METRQVDTRAVRKLYTGNACARALLDQFATRQQDRAEVSVDRLIQLLGSDGHTFTRAEVIDTLKALQALGAGAFVVGRKGHCSRFVRSVNLAELGKLARGTNDSSAPLTVVANPSSVEKRDVVVHRYVLRAGFTVTLHLPADFSNGEAARFSEFIKTLPFSP